MSNPAKRGHAPPSGDTPGKNPAKKTANAHHPRSRKTLFQSELKPPAKVNIAGPSTRTIRRMIEKSYTKGCEIQISALKHLHSIYPSARCWIKADGTDVMLEYTKKCDPDLPFYHYTGVNEWFHSGCLPSFNQPTGNREECLDHVTISRRADPVIPKRGQLTVRAAHFRPAENLPPAPPIRPTT